MSERAWITHEEFERRHPRFLAADVGAAQAMARKGRRPWREFPCPGSIVGPDDGSSTNVWGVCDACGFEVGFSRAEAEPTVVGDQIIAQANLPLGLLQRPYVKTQANELARAALRKFVEAWPEDRTKPPLFVGEPGRGKTHLLALAAVTLARRYAVRVRYWSVAGLLDSLKSSYDRDGVCTEWDRALDAPLLVLDDLGAERATDWSRERICTLLDHRYRAGSPLLSATNVPVDGWASEFGPRSASRLAGMTRPVRIGGPDWRLIDDAVPSDGPDTNPSHDIL